MNNIKRHLISAGLTFVGTFVTALCATFSVSGYTFTKEATFAAVAGALVMAGRAIIKIIWEIGSDLLASSKEE